MDLSGVEFVVKNVCKKIKVNCVSLQLHKNAEFCLHYLDENEKEFKRDYFKLEGEDYEKWGECDDYIYHYACKHFGLCNEEETCEENVENIVEDASGVEVVEDASGVVVEDASGEEHMVLKIEEDNHLEKNVRNDYEEVIQNKIKILQIENKDMDDIEQKVRSEYENVIQKRIEKLKQKV